MKKITVVLILCLTLCSLMSCTSNSSLIEDEKKLTGLLNSTTEASVTENESSEPILSEKSTDEKSPASSEATSSPLPTTEKKTAKPTTKASKKTECTHTFTKTVFPSSCIEKGYTLHTCTKCGAKKTDSYVPAGHQYHYKVCEICGQLEPNNLVTSLCYWLNVYGEISPSGKLFQTAYVENGFEYKVMGLLNYYDSIYLVLESEEEHFSVAFSNDKDCYISYSVHFDQANGGVNIPKSALSSSNPVKFDTFSNNGDKSISEEDFAIQLTQKIDGFMKAIQDKVLFPRTGVTLKKLGFTAY